MKICFLGDAKSIHIKKWCKFFKDNGDDVNLITFRYDKIEGINVIDVGNSCKIKNSGGNIGYLSKLYAIRKIIKRLNPDIVNAHYLTSYGLLAALSYNGNLVVTTWGSDILVTPGKNLFYNAITQFVLCKAKLITSDSEYMSKKIEELVSKKINIITSPMGIDTSVFNLNNRNDNIVNKNIVSLRTLNNNSNIDIIIKAFSRIALEINDVKLIIANDGDEMDNITKLVEKLELDNKVEILGSVDIKKVAEILKDNYIYISIPTSDSTSVSLLEAMASGIYPIVSPIPANLEWIKDDYNGYVIHDINEDSLYKAIKNILVNDNLVKDAANINNQIINNRAVWRNNMNFIRDSYLKLL